jgi:uncharacterized protein (DUF885 family)
MTTRRDLLAGGAAAAALLAAGAGHGAGPAAGDRAPPRSPMGERLMAFLERADRDDLALDPQAAVLRGELARAHEFGDYLSDAHWRAVETGLRAQWRGFAGIDRTQLAPGAERVAYDMYRYQAQHALRRFDEGLVVFAKQLPIDHLFGQHVTFAQFSSGQAAPFRTAKDYADGLARLGGFASWLERVIPRLREGIGAGRVLTRSGTGRVVAQLDAALALAVEASPLYAPILALPAEWPEADRTRLAHAYRDAIENRVRPALRRLADFMRGEYLEASRGGAPGIGALPGGAAWYAYQLETMTTLRLGADAVHRSGLAEVARIRAEMERIRRRVGFGGTLSAFFEHLRDDTKYKFASAAELLDAYRATGARVDGRLGRLFSRLPKSRLEIREVPAHLQGSVAGASYQVGTPDGSRPGVFYVNTGELPTRTRVRVTALYLHEALPGHHLQGSLAQEAEDLPPLLRYNWNVGYGEGWGLYAEWLGHEMGLYDDPIQHFGQLDMEIFRAARLVVDTGLHARGWSRQRAIDYMASNTSLERSFIADEVDRYIAWPGQACAYKLGELTFKRLRARATRALGARLDVRAFHAQVLDTGALPLAVLESKIDEWISGGGR